MEQRGSLIIGMSQPQACSCWLPIEPLVTSHGTLLCFLESLFGVCISEIYHVGINYFDEAVKHGLFEYEISKDTTDQAEYAKQVCTVEAG